MKPGGKVSLVDHFDVDHIGRVEPNATLVVVGDSGSVTCSQ